MTLTLELDPELQAIYKAEADRRGVDPGAVALEVLRAHRPTPPPAESGRLTVEEFHKMLDELRAGLEDLPHLPDSALTREGIYGDHP
ncbi:MAG: hypothetical protein WCE75_17165 [Terracidiphilus sp.]